MNTDCQIEISTTKSGFYKGINKYIAVTSKLFIAVLVLFAIVLPDKSSEMLGTVNGYLLSLFNSYYIFSVSLFLIFCLFMAVGPTGKIKIGSPDSKPEFTNFSWFAMMFSAGMGIGLMFYSIGEPIYHFANNPEVIKGAVEAKVAATIDSSMRYSFLHWGLHAWGIYVAVGLAMAYFAFNRGMPMSIRSALTPIFGDKLNGILGNAVDVIAVVATVLGISVTVGTGVSQLVSGLESLTGASWLTGEDGKATTLAMTFALLTIMALSTLSAVSGVGKGVKWLSNVNLSLSFVLIVVFLIFGSVSFALDAYFSGLIDYIVQLPAMSFTVFDKESALGKWQSGWTIYYWAWWIAYAPFVGMFLARISKGRTIREFVLGALIVPTLMCFIWFALFGGTALDLELNGGANGAIIGAAMEAQMFVTLEQMLSPELAQGLSAMIIVLILTYLITTADSGVLVLNTIMSGGAQETGIRHRIVWGVILTVVIASLTYAGGLGAIQKAMIIGALPFSVIMILMCISTLKAVFSKQQVNSQTTVQSAALKTND